MRWGLLLATLLWCAPAWAVDDLLGPCTAQDLGGTCGDRRLGQRALVYADGGADTDCTQNTENLLTLCTFNGTSWVGTPVGGSTSAVYDKTTSYTVPTALAYGNVFTNLGAAGTIKITLPLGSAGMSATFLVLASQVLQVDINAADQILGPGITTTDGAGNFITNDGTVLYSSVVLTFVGGGRWIVLSTTGGEWLDGE